MTEMLGLRGDSSGSVRPSLSACAFGFGGHSRPPSVDGQWSSSKPRCARKGFVEGSGGTDAPAEVENVEHALVVPDEHRGPRLKVLATIDHEPDVQRPAGDHVERARHYEEHVELAADEGICPLRRQPLMLSTHHVSRGRVRGRGSHGIT